MEGIQGMSTSGCSCVVCMENFMPATCNDSGEDQMNQLKTVSEVFKVFFLYLRRNDYFSCRSSDWDSFTNTQKLSSFCSSCFSSGVKLSVMYGQLEQLQQEIENFVDGFENAISIVHKAERTVSDCFMKEQESVDISACNDLNEFHEDFKSEYSGDNLESDWNIDAEIKQETSTDDICNTAYEEIAPFFNPVNYADYSKSVKCSVNCTNKNNATQSEMKTLCIKLERLPESVCKKLINPRISKLQNKTGRRKRRDTGSVNTCDSLLQIKDEKLFDVKIERTKSKSKSSNTNSSNYLTMNQKLSKIQKKPNKSIIKSQRKRMKPQMLSFNCAPCNLTFTSSKLYGIHLRDHANPKKSKECKICGKRFYGEYSFEKHMSSNHAELTMEYKCSTCKENFSSKFDLEIHEMIHIGDVPFKCHSCHEIFSTSNSYANHQMHSPCPVYENFHTFECELCEKSFKAQYLLLSHTAEHKKVARGTCYQCPTCGREFKKMCYLREHILNHHCQQEFPFTCDICGKPLRSPEGIRGHRQSHRALANVLCSKCGMCFKSKNALNYHRSRYHPTDGELFKCDVCPKVFKVKEDFRRHVTLHSKSFICDICGNKFNRSIDLKTHHRSHTGDLLPCLTCDKKFLTLYLLNQHIAVTHFGRSKPCSGKKRGIIVEPDK